MKKMLLISMLMLMSIGFVLAEVNTKYSYKDFSDKSLKEFKAEDFNNTEIVGSCFYQQAQPNTDIFPKDMAFVTFTNCNLDNVKIPIYNTVGTGNTHKQLKIQNDLCIWILDKDSKAFKPLNEAEFIKLKLSILPEDIPENKLEKSIIKATQEAKEAELKVEKDKFDKLTDDEKITALKSLNLEDSQ